MSRCDLWASGCVLPALVFAALIAAASPLSAQTIPIPTTINGTDAGEKPIQIAGDDVHMRATDLETFGTGGPVWQRLINFGRLRNLAAPIEGADAVSLKSLAPYVDFKFDQDSSAPYGMISLHGAF